MPSNDCSIICFRPINKIPNSSGLCWLWTVQIYHCLHWSVRLFTRLRHFALILQRGTRSPAPSLISNTTLILSVQVQHDETHYCSQKAAVISSNVTEQLEKQEQVFWECKQSPKTDIIQDAVQANQFHLIKGLVNLVMMAETGLISL